MDAVLDTLAAELRSHAKPPAGATPATRRYAGRSLADVLRDLQSLGLKVVFSSELVRPDMRVATEPASTTPRTILDEVLEPHGLRAVAGPKDTWLVVRARLSVAPALVPPFSTLAPSLRHAGIGPPARKNQRFASSVAAR
jgi:hypothetical protein